MSDRWVWVYIAVCLLQLPFYLYLGRTSLSFDFRMDRVERELLRQDLTDQELTELFKELGEAEALLRKGQIQDSRWARVWLNQAMISWHLKDFRKTEKFFRRALKGFEDTHGVDSFYVGGVECRYGEFLLQGGRYGEALSRFESGLAAVQDSLGPDDPFTLRIVFRKVAALVQFGRLGEAQELAEQSCPGLLAQAGLYDQSFLHWTGQALDSLTRAGKLQSPPGGMSWVEALEEARQQGRGLEEAKRTEGP